jgi:hypothetical protein
MPQRTRTRFLWLPPAIGAGLGLGVLVGGTDKGIFDNSLVGGAIAGVAFWAYFARHSKAGVVGQAADGVVEGTLRLLLYAPIVGVGMTIGVVSCMLAGNFLLPPLIGVDTLTGRAVGGVTGMGVGIVLGARWCNRWGDAALEWVRARRARTRRS